MRCGLKWDAGDCIRDHWAEHAPTLKLAKSGNGPHWRGRCPACGGAKVLEVTDKGETVAYRCFRDPRCPTAELRPILLRVVACHAVKAEPLRLPRSDAVPRSELAELLTLTDAAMRLRLASLVWQLPAKEAAAKLGMSRRTFYRAVSEVPDLARNRRSGA